MSRINPREEWIITEVPELRIVDDELWRAVKDRQEELTERYATVIEATRTARANRLNGTHRPRHLLSGLLECGACGGPYAMRGQDRYSCSNHVMNGSCSNSRGIRRTELEERVLIGLRDHLMAPDIAGEAVRALGGGDQPAQPRAQRLKRGGAQGARRDREEDREDRCGDPGRRLQPHAQGKAAQARSPKGGADETSRNGSRRDPGHPPERRRHFIAARWRVSRRPSARRRERDAAAAAIRELIDGIVLTPVQSAASFKLRCAASSATSWSGRKRPKTKDRHSLSGMSVSVVAGVGFEPTTFRL